MFYFDVLEGLYRKEIRYLIVGGLAVNLHGVPRVTQDVDMLISLDYDNVRKACGLLKELDYVPRLPVDPMGMADERTLFDWTNNRNLKAFSFYHSKENYRTIDIVLDKTLDFSNAFERKCVIKARNIEIYVACIDDLILMKKSAGRSKDLSDAEMLEQAKIIIENNG